MPSCSLCEIDFPALSPGVACKHCIALQALGVDHNHPNYIQTKVSSINILINSRFSSYVASELEAVPSLRYLCPSSWYCSKCSEGCLLEPSLCHMGNFIRQW